MLVHLQEYPLRPLIVLGVCGVNAAIPVESIAQHLELACEVCDVVFCNYGRMDVVLDGIVFRGQAESIKADGEQNIVALHPLFAGDDIHGSERSGVTDMQSLTRGVRELDQSVELGTGRVAGYGRIGLGLLPICLPLLFNCCKIVFHF